MSAASARIFEVLSLGRRSGRKAIAVLVCYLDDSSADTAAVQTIAGYVADHDAWIAFENEAEELCERMHIDVIHARELEAGKGCFDRWSVTQKIEFMVRLGDIMQPLLRFGISRSVVKDTYKLRKIGRKKDASLSSYGFAFETLVFSLSAAPEFGTSEEVQANGISYLVESGHPNNPDLQRYNQEVKAGKLHRSTSITFIDKLSCRAVQLADLYAFFSRRKANRHVKSRGRIAMFPDPLFHHLERRLTHHTGLIEDPYRIATIQRTGDTFEVRGLVTGL